MALVSFELGIAIGTGSEGHGRMALLTFERGITIGTCSGGQQKAMALITLGLGTTTRTGSGGNGRQWRWYLSGWKPRLGHAREATGGNGFGNFRAGNHHWD